MAGQNGEGRAAPGNGVKLHKRSAEANSLGRCEAPAIKKRITPEAADRGNVISNRQEINRASYFFGAMPAR